MAGTCAPAARALLNSMATICLRCPLADLLVSTVRGLLVKPALHVGQNKRLLLGRQVLKLLSARQFISSHLFWCAHLTAPFTPQPYSTALLQRRLSGCRLDECVALQHNCTDVLPAVKRAVHIIVAAIISDVHTSAAREAQRCSLTAYCGRYRGLAHCESRDDNEWNPYKRHPTDSQDDVAGLSGQRNCDCDRRCRPRDDRARRSGDGDGRRSLARSEVVARKNHWSPYRTEDR